jgi:hypothetical protein
VIGHSDTVLAIIQTAGGPASSGIDQDEFDNPFVLTGSRGSPSG